MAPLQAPVRTTFTHQALLYRSIDEFADTLVPFVCDGTDAGDVVVVVVAPANLEALRDRLPGRSRAQAHLLSSSKFYRHPARALNANYLAISEYAATGRAVRLIGEQPLTELPPEHVREFCRVDSVFDEVCAFPGVSVVCPYHLKALPSTVIDCARHSHREIVQDGVRRPSRQYRPPTQLLGEARTGPLPSPAAPVRQLVRPSNPGEARSFVEDNVRELWGDVPDLDDFLLAVSEVVANALTHAKIDRVRIWRDTDRIVCEVLDRGVGMPDVLAGYRQPDPETLSGRGMWLVHQLTHLVEVSTGPAGTTVRLHLTTNGATPETGRDR